jgi:hypothetical protein
MSALEGIAGIVTAPGATFTQVTNATNNTFTVRNYNNNNDTPRAHLITGWLYSNIASGTAGAKMRLRSALLHDQQQGIRFVAGAANGPQIPFYSGVDQPLRSQDNIVCEVQGSAVGGQIETAHALIYYEDLPGVKARLIDPLTLRRQGINMVGVEVALNPGAGGGWTGQRLLTYTMDTLQANTDYALIGCVTDVNCGAVRLQGADTGNLGVIMPGGVQNSFVSANFFPLISANYGFPMIPVISGSNKAAILVDCTQTQAGTAVNASLFFVELAPGTMIS